MINLGIPHPVKTFNPESRAPIFICFQILKPSLRKHPFLARNVPSSEERGETDVFAGYLKPGLRIVQIKQIPHPEKPIVDPHIGSFLSFTLYFLNSWLKLEKRQHFLKYHSLCNSS